MDVDSARERAAGPGVPCRCCVLSEHEQEIWDGLVRDQQTEHDEALPAAVIGGGWSAVLLVLFGVPMAGLAIGAATVLVWLLWRFLPRGTGHPTGGTRHPPVRGDLPG